MLVLSRRANQRVLFPDVRVTVQVVEIKAGAVRLGVQAPPDVAILREELLQRDAANRGQARAERSADRQDRHWVRNRLNASTIGLALLRRQLENGMTQAMQSTLDRINDELQALRCHVEAPAAPASPVGCRALLVEDDDNERELLAGFLRMAGVEVSTAGDGADALDHLRTSELPDVVLLDMILPRMDGLATVRAIRANPAFAGLRIFGMTGAAREQLGLEEGPRGVDGWFRKPLDPEALLRELEQKIR